MILTRDLLPLNSLYFQLFSFADKYRGKYSDAIAGAVCPFYCSYSGYNVSTNLHKDCWMNRYGIFLTPIDQQINLYESLLEQTSSRGLNPALQIPSKFSNLSSRLAQNETSFTIKEEEEVVTKAHLVFVDLNYLVMNFASWFSIDQNISIFQFRTIVLAII